MDKERYLESEKVLCYLNYCIRDHKGCWLGKEEISRVIDYINALEARLNKTSTDLVETKNNG